MGAVDLSGLPDNALLLVDTNPIIYELEQRADFAPIFRAVFDAQRDGRVRLAVTTMTVAEVLVMPIRAGNEVLVGRYKAAFRSWFVVEMDADIAESAARLRAKFGLKLPDAVNAASAIAIGADALVTHDRDFSSLTELRVLGV